MNVTSITNSKKYFGIMQKLLFNICQQRLIITYDENGSITIVIFFLLKTKLKQKRKKNRNTSTTISCNFV